ncbi:MAG: LolA family protein [bacterium]
MRKTINWLLAVLMAAACAPLSKVSADSGSGWTLQQVCQKVEAAQTQAQDVQMDLKMRMRDTLSGQTQEVQGEVDLKSPNLVYAHYRKPTEEFLYVDGEVALMYRPDQKMVYRQKSAGAEPVYLGVGRELKGYVKTCRVSMDRNSGNQVELLFKPKDSNAAFTSMKVTVDTKNWWPVRVEVETPALNTQAEFSHFRFNQGLSAKLFQFTRPKGVDLVEGAIF